MDLVKEINGLMFKSDEEPVMISTDRSKMIMVMAALSAFEKQVNACNACFMLHGLTE